MAALLIVGLLAVWLIPAQLSWTSAQPRSKPWRSLLYGFLILLLGWFVALIALLLVLGLAFFLFWVSLPNLGFLVGSLGVLAIGLASVIYWLSIAYFSKVVIAFLLGRMIFSKSTSRYAQGRVRAAPRWGDRICPGRLHSLSGLGHLCDRNHVWSGSALDCCIPSQGERNYRAGPCRAVC